MASRVKLITGGCGHIQQVSTAKPVVCPGPTISVATAVQCSPFVVGSNSFELQKARNVFIVRSAMTFPLKRTRDIPLETSTALLAGETNSRSLLIVNSDKRALVVIFAWGIREGGELSFQQDVQPTYCVTTRSAERLCYEELVNRFLVPLDQLELNVLYTENLNHLDGVACATFTVRYDETQHV